MRIRDVFLLSIVLGSAVGVMATLLFTLQQWSALHDAQVAVGDTYLLASALRLPETMNMERAYINPRLVAAAAATPEQMVPVQRQDELVDAATAQAGRLAVVPADRAALQAIGTQLLAIRRSALAAIVRPLAGRSAATVANYLAQMFYVQEAAYAFAVTVQARINANNHDLGLATRLAVLAWDLRDWSGRQTTTLIGDIAQHLPMTGQQAERLAEYKGRIEQKWWAAQAAAMAVNSPDVMKALAGVERGFWARGGEANDTWVVPNRGRTLDLDPDAFVAAIAPVLNNILPLRDAAIQEALRLGDADITMRRDRFLLAQGFVLLAVIAAAAVIRWFDRRVVGPVELITTTILALASGNRDVLVPLQGRTDELGQMAQAIETLRRNAIQAEAVGHEVLALQHARAEEKSRLLTDLTQSNVDLAALNQELESLATTDALTGVSNRRSFNLVMTREWLRAQREETSLGLLLLDVDHFKEFNDRYGHPAGDVCLARLAAAIVGAVRRPADVTARYGGEEFAVVLPATGLEGATSIAEQIRRAVATLNIRHIDSEYGTVTVSVGVSVIVPRSWETPETLVSGADSALYEAKNRGRNQVATARGAGPVLQAVRLAAPAAEQLG
jgi:diguanylate cyclase (GGDEF)-like protein